MKSKEQIIKLSLINFFLHLFFLSPVAVFFYQNKGLNYFQILSLESILMVSILLFELPTGIIADKLSKKKAIVIGSFFLVLEPLILLFSSNYYMFAIAFALAGLGITFHSGSIEALIYESLKAEKKTSSMKKAMGTFGSSRLTAMVIAPIIGSYIAKDLLMSQFKLLLLMTVGFMFLGILISFTIKNIKSKICEETSSILLFKEGLKLLKKNKSFCRIVFLSIFSSPFIFTLNYLYQPYLQNSNVSIGFFGTIFAISLLGAAFLQKYSYKFESILGMKKSILFATLVPGILYILMGLISLPILSILLIISLRSVSGLAQPLFSDYQNTHITEKGRATILSLISMLMAIYLLFMRLIIGKLADYNLKYSFFLMGTIVIISSILLKIDENHIIQKSSISF